MSDISMPPEQPAAPTPAPATKKYLLDNLGVKFFVLVMGYISPLPVAMMIAQFWLDRTNNGAVSGVSLASEALDGTNGAPQWIWPLAFVPALVLFLICFKSTRGKIGALVSLVVISFAIIALFFQLQPTVLP